MTKDHSTTRSYRIHQFLRVCVLVSTMLLLLASIAASGGSVGAISLNAVTVVSALLGIFIAELADWLMWGIAEGLGGKNGIFAPQ